MNRPARWAAAVLTGLLGALVAGVIGAAPASAHDTLLQSSPAAGATVTSPVEQVWLYFDQTARVTGHSIRVLDAGGHEVDEADAREGDKSSQVVIDLRPGLAAGAYIVCWQIVSADGHPVAGAYTFGVNAPAATSAVRAPHGSLLVGVIDAVGRFVFQTAAALLVGAAFFLLVLWPEGLDRPATARLLQATWAAAFLSAAVLLVLEGSYGTGRGLATTFHPSVVRAALGNRAGHLTELRLVLLLLAAPLLRNVANRRDGGQAETAVVGVGVLAGWAVVSHASDGTDTWLSISVMVAHLAAVSVWFGGLVVLAGFLLPHPDADILARVMPRWAGCATAAVAVIASTGVYLTWREVGTLPALPGTVYGRYLLVKLGLVAVVWTLGWTGHRWVSRHYRPVVFAAGPVVLPAETATPDPGPGEVCRLRRTVCAEIVIAGLVLAVTAVLIDGKPARLAYGPAITQSLVAGPTSERLRISSTWHGPADVTLLVTDPTGKPLRGAAIDAALTLPKKGVGPITVTFPDTGAGGITVGHTVAPFSGRWYLRLTVHTDTFDEYTATTSYYVH
ncbi:MAG: copper resistance protein CopC [Frankia sp.]